MHTVKQTQSTKGNMGKIRLSHPNPSFQNLLPRRLSLLTVAYYIFQSVLYEQICLCVYLYILLFTQVVTYCIYIYLQFAFLDLINRYAILLFELPRQY